MAPGQAVGKSNDLVFVDQDALVTGETQLFLQTRRSMVMISTSLENRPILWILSSRLLETKEVLVVKGILEHDLKVARSVVELKGSAESLENITGVVYYAIDVIHAAEDGLQLHMC